MEKKMLEENESKEKMERAQKADAHLSSVNQLMYLQTFCALLGANVPALAKNTPEIPYGDYFLLLVLLVMFITLGREKATGIRRGSTGFVVLIVCIVTFCQILITNLTAFQLITDTYFAVMNAVWPCESQTINQNLDLTARNLMDFLVQCIRIIAIFVMVLLGFWVYQMYHFAKLDQPKKSNKEQPKQQIVEV